MFQVSSEPMQSAPHPIEAAWRRFRNSIMYSISKYIASVFVAADPGEAWMTEPVIRRPSQKLDAGDQEWIEPGARGHLGGREAFAPAAFATVPQVTERASGYLKFLEMRQQHTQEFG